MIIIIRTIPHEAQRYDTVGDWSWSESGDTLQINVSECNRDSEFLVGLHEFIEAFIFTRRMAYRSSMSKATALATKAADEFDMTWKEHDDIAEPGDDPAAPYHEEHVFATNIERLAAQFLMYEWAEHEEVLSSFPAKP